MAEAMRLGRVLFGVGLRETARLIDEGAARLRRFAEQREGALAGGSTAGLTAPAVDEPAFDPGTRLATELERLEARAGAARLIHLDVGPLANFGQLLGIQDAASEIDGAQVGIERFSNRRAQLAVQVDDTIDLLRELELRTDLEFTVRARDRDDLVLDLG